MLRRATAAFSLALCGFLFLAHCQSTPDSGGDSGADNGTPNGADGGVFTSDDGGPPATNQSDGAVGARDGSATPHDGATPGDGAASRDAPSPPPPTFLPTKNAFTADQIAVIVNLDDPISVAVGSYYQTKRNIPAANVVSVHIPTGTATITSAQFATVSTAVAAALPAGIEAYALTFTQPYEVDGMSITSAFAFGYGTQWTNTTGGACGQTANSPYYGTDDQKPFEDLAMRPAMMLAGSSQSDVLALIDRGVASDDTHPKGTDYMIITTDVARSSREYEFDALAASWDPASGVAGDLIDNADGGGLDYITGKTDVLFYFTGLASVPDITMNTYLPGAMADHLTSYGGQVPTSGQMSAAAWLAAGATASFGTVVEPCNYTEKFPDPTVAVPRYYQGATAMEAYWKSVVWPGEGLFIGEPLAAPWKSPIVTFAGGTLTIETTALDPTVQYDLEGANAEAGPFTKVQMGISVAKYDVATVTVHSPTYAYYRLEAEGAGDE